MIFGPYGILFVTLAVAAWTDWNRQRVGNGLLLAAAAAGIWLFRFRFVIPAFVMLLAAFMLFRLRLLGAGDGKLMAVIMGYLGWKHGLEAIFFGFFLGAVWELCHLRHSRILIARLNYFAAYLSRIIQKKQIEVYRAPSGEGKFPLAVFLAAGTYLYVAVSGLMTVIRPIGQL